MSLVVPSVEGERAPVWSTLNLWGNTIRGMANITAGPGSASWPVNNQAYVIPFQVSTPVTFLEMFMVGGTTPGTTAFDLGIYNESFTRLTSIGATAALNNAGVVLPVGGGTLNPVVTLNRGRYYLAMSAASTTLQVTASTYANQVLRAFGMFTMATAHPLPATFVPASMGTSTFMPTIFAATITNII